MSKDSLKILKEVYGYSEFRKGQKEIIDSIIDKNDTLAIMPTGGGKSLCYQIPALALDGVSIVISPLISLMKDQIDTLNSLGVKAAFINSTLESIEIEEVLFRLRNGDLKLVYIAPERLKDKSFIAVLNEIEVSQISIDEAHCISQWGHDFRSSYRQISSFINTFNKRPVITAFTATASKRVQEDIVNILEMQNANVFVSGFDRENIEIQVIKGIDKKDYITKYLEENKDLSGIIYASTRKEVEELSRLLNNKGIEVLKYHAGLSEKERSKNQEDFIFDTNNLIIATNAFGMGIDKPNVRFVIHYSMPGSVEAYYQEIGRAGRDGEKSEAILLFDPLDVRTHKFLIDSSVKNIERKNEELKKLQDMLDFVYTNNCYRKYILNYFEEEANDKCDNCSNCNIEFDEVDRTLDAQKVLSCVYRMKREYGIGVIIDVLRGSKVKKILDLGFDKLTTYGIMKHISKEDLKEFINTLVAQGDLGVRIGEYPTLFINNEAIKILKNEKKVMLRDLVIKRNLEKENELYSLLKAEIVKIAKAKAVAPYSILGDSSIKEMSIKFPTDKTSFLDIQGVNLNKFNEFGETIISIISDYKEKNNIKLTDMMTKEVKSELAALPMYVDSNMDLLEELKDLRDKIAKRENMYKSYVLSLNTLKEISGRYPTDKEELTDISGIGPKKIDSYGAEFISVVKEFINKNNIEVNWETKGRKKIVIDGETRNAKEITIDDLNSNIDITQISDKLELSVSTILGYVAEYILDGHEYTFNIDTVKYYTNAEKQEILSKIDDIKNVNIAKVKRELPREIKYESIRAVVLEEILKLS